MTQVRPPFQDYVIYADDGNGKAYGGIDGIRDDVPDEMKIAFWKWIAMKWKDKFDGIMV